MSFAAHFPYLVNSIVLLAPGGIIRAVPKQYQNIFFRFPSLIPSRYLKRLVGNAVGAKLATTPRNRTGLNESILEQGESTASKESTSMANPTRIAPAVVQWQYENHQGFIHSFTNNIQHGPIMHQHADWNKICRIIKAEDSGLSGSCLSSRLYDSRILVVFGSTDSIVVAREVSEDLEQMLGGLEHVEFRTVLGDHGFPVPNSEEVVMHISDFWKLGRAA